MNAELMQKEVVRELPFEDMMKLFETLTFREKWAKVRYGLKQPRESGEYKWAALQIRRLISPLSAVAVPALGLLLMVTLAGMKPLPKPLPTIRITDQAPPPDLIDPVLPPENPPPPDPERIVDPSADFMPSPGKTQAGPNTDFSPQTAPLTAVAMIRSKVVMRGILRARRPGVRGDLLKKGGGGSHTERAVMLALRWLKQNQAADGSWLGGTEQLNDSKVKAAMTGLALLTYLAHDEKTDSPEFGETVAKAIKWLLDNQVAGGGWNRSYQHPIATYALCEAYAMTRIPDVREAAERGLELAVPVGSRPGQQCQRFLRHELVYTGSEGRSNRRAESAGSGRGHGKGDPRMAGELPGSLPRGPFSVQSARPPFPRPDRGRRTVVAVAGRIRDGRGACRHAVPARKAQHFPMGGRQVAGRLLLVLRHARIRMARWWMSATGAPATIAADG